MLFLCASRTVPFRFVQHCKCTDTSASCLQSRKLGALREPDIAAAWQADRKSSNHPRSDSFGPSLPIMSPFTSPSTAPSMYVAFSQTSIPHWLLENFLGFHTFHHPLKHSDFFALFNPLISTVHKANIRLSRYCNIFNELLWKMWFSNFGMYKIEFPRIPDYSLLLSTICIYFHRHLHVFRYLGRKTFSLS